jgi:hypothetical protein
MRLKKIARDTGAELIDPFEWLCDSIACPAIEPDGTPMYVDDNHVRAPFAKHLTIVDGILAR